MKVKIKSEDETVMDDPLALTDIVPTSDNDERELENAREWGAAYWRHVVERRSALEVSIRRDRVRTRSVTPPARLAPRPRTPPPAQHSPRPPPPEEPEYQALLAFQNARTFRPRTALQLQPYTRERLAYQAVVRRGGGRGLVRDLDVQPGEEDVEDGVYQEPTIDESIRSPSPHVEPTTQDLTTYATLHPDSTTPSPTNIHLQQLTKARLRTEEEAARTERRRKRKEREFARVLEAEMRERERVNKEARKVQRREGRERRAAEGAANGAGKARTKTYARRGKVVDVAQLLKGLSSSGSSPSEGESPDHSKRKRIRQSPVEGNEGDVLDLGMDGPQDSPERRPTTTINISSSDSDEDSSQADEAPEPGHAIPGKNARALNRMLPAFMIKRLAQGATPRARPRNDTDQEPDEEAERPGRARVRIARGPERERGAVLAREEEGYGDDSMGIFDDLNDEQGGLSPPQMASPPLFSPPRMFSPPPPGRFAAVPSLTTASISTLSSDSSESDDDGADSVRLLHAGAFSRLLNGERDRAPAQKKRAAPAAGGNGLLRAARSARGTVRRPKAAGKAKEGKRKRTEQARLMFPQAAAGRAGETGDGKRKPRARARRVLDDHTIFEVSDGESVRTVDAVPIVQERAASSPANGGRPVQRRPRVSAHAPITPRGPRKVATTRPAPPATTTTPHKASLWTDLQDFQVDFDVKPLPSGVSFAGDTWLGSAGLERYLESLTDSTPARAAPVVVFGISLTHDMPYAELLQLLPTVMNGVHDQILGQCNGRAPTEPDYMASFDFLDGYMVAHAEHHATDEATRIVQDLLERLTGIRSARGPAPDDRQHLFLIDASLAIFKLLLRIYFHWPQAAASATLENSIHTAAQDVVERLLVFGFDRTMKPLKAIMAFAADQPVLTDFTAECWITVIHLLRAVDSRSVDAPNGSSFSKAMDTVVQRLYVENHAGPRASERIWYITFGLAAFHQFGADGVTLPDLQDYPQWSLVRKALSLIKFPDYTEAEEHEKRHQLKSRDKYIKIMVIRCLQLTCTWQWRCDRDSFAIATRDLGNLFKERHLRNLPNEASSDFPAFIREYDLKRSSEVDIEESTYNLYLQLVCVSASDLIAGARDMKEAEQSVKDVQKLMLAIFPFSPVVPAANGVFNGKQLGALVNRFSALVVAILFVPSLLGYLSKLAQKWADFNCGDIEVQRICLRGLMYVGVAARHHSSSVEPVVDRLADIFETVHETKRSLEAHHGDKIKEQERLLILLVSCYRQIIERHSFDRELQEQPAYPDPCLLHTCEYSDFSLDLNSPSGHRLDQSIEFDRSHHGPPRRVRSHRDHSGFSGQTECGASRSYSFYATAKAQRRRKSTERIRIYGDRFYARRHHNARRGDERDLADQRKGDCVG